MTTYRSPTINAHIVARRCVDYRVLPPEVKREVRMETMSFINRDGIIAFIDKHEEIAPLNDRFGDKVLAVTKVAKLGDSSHVNLVSYAYQVTFYADHTEDGSKQVMIANVCEMPDGKELYLIGRLLAQHMAFSDTKAAVKKDLREAIEDSKSTDVVGTRALGEVFGHEFNFVYGVYVAGPKDAQPKQDGKVISARASIEDRLAASSLRIVRGSA